MPFSLNQIKGRFKSFNEQKAAPIANPTHLVFADFEERFEIEPHDYTYEAELTSDEVEKLRQAGYKVSP
jgi:hypothetical protein